MLHSYKTVNATFMIGIIFLFWLLTVALNAGGHLSYDSIVQLTEARTRVLFSGHPPVMSMLMSFGDDLVPGTLVFMIAMSGVFFGSLSVTTRAGSAGRVGSLYLLLAVICMASPLVLIYQGIIWKDVLFANLFVLTFALAVIARLSSTQWKTLIWIAVAAVVAGLSGLVRQQGLISPVMLVFSVALMPAPSFSSRGFRAALAVVVAFAAMFTIDQGISFWAHGARPDFMSAGLRSLRTFDIVGMAAGGTPLPSTLPSQDRAAILDYANLYYTAARIDPLGAPPMPAALLAANFPTDETWRSMLTDNPMVYAMHRWAHMSWLVWPADISKCVPIHLGVSGDPDMLRALGLSTIERPGLYSYSKLWFNTPFYRHGFWALASVVLLAILVRRRCRVPGDEVVLSALVGAQLFAVSFLLIGLACDFRYLYTLPMTVIFASLWVAAGVGGTSVQRHES